MTAAMVIRLQTARLRRLHGLSELQARLVASQAYGARR